MGHLIVLAWIALAAARPHPADVSWTAGVPLWTSLSPGGKVLDAGPLAGWASPPPAARLADPQPVPPPTVLPPPRELPEVVSVEAEVVKPMVTPGAPLTSFATDPLPAVALPAPTPPEPTGPPPLAVQATRRSPGRPPEVSPAKINAPKP